MTQKNKLTKRKTNVGNKKDPDRENVKDKNKIISKT